MTHGPVMCGIPTPCRFINPSTSNFKGRFQASVINMSEHTTFVSGKLLDQDAFEEKSPTKLLLRGEFAVSTANRVVISERREHSRPPNEESRSSL